MGIAFSTMVLVYNLGRIARLFWRARSRKFDAHERRELWALLFDTALAIAHFML